MNTSLFWVAFPIALLDWLAVGMHWKRLEYLTKPAVMLLLLTWLWQMSGFQGQLVWFAAGLVFSLAGDVLLILPKQLFLAGLVAFLLAQIAYLVGLNPTLPPVNLPSLILALLVGLTAWRLYPSIASGLQAAVVSKLKLPMLVYSLVASLMLLSALLTLVRPEWAEGSAWLVAAGALFFFLSDILLAWDKFVQPLPGRPVRIMISYHVGQLLIILGAALHYLK